MGSFFYKHIVHPFLSHGLGKKAFCTNPYLLLILDADEEKLIADELFLVSMAYQKGLYALPKEEEKAMDYCLKAAERGHVIAQLFAAQWLMRGSDDHSKQVLSWLTKAANQGERQALYNIGISYHRGDFDGKIDIEKSNKCFRQSAEQGYKSACERMALIYLQGEGVEKSSIVAKYWAWLDYAAATTDEERKRSVFNELIERSDIAEDNRILHRKIIEEAAAAGEPAAMYDLGKEFLRSGDEKKAVDVLRKAVEMGHHIAMRDMAMQLLCAEEVMLHTGCSMAMRVIQFCTEEVKRYEEAFPLFFKSAEWGCAEAQLGLAIMYYEGLGVEKNANKAWKWLEKSINFGCCEARTYFSNICMNEDMAAILPGSAEICRVQNYMELSRCCGSS